MQTCDMAATEQHNHTAITHTHTHTHHDGHTHTHVCEVLATEQRNHSAITNTHTHTTLDTHTHETHRQTHTHTCCALVSSSSSRRRFFSGGGGSTRTTSSHLRPGGCVGGASVVSRCAGGVCRGCGARWQRQCRAVRSHHSSVLRHAARPPNAPRGARASRRVVRRSTHTHARARRHTGVCSPLLCDAPLDDVLKGGGGLLRGRWRRPRRVVILHVNLFDEERRV